MRIDRESKDQLSRVRFGPEKKKLSTNVGLFSRPFNGVLQLKQSVYAPFLAILHRIFGLQEGSLLGLALVSPFGVNIGLKV